MEKEKYFVPDIEDIRVGYECEIQVDIRTSEGEKVDTMWQPYIFKKQDIAVSRKEEKSFTLTDILCFHNNIRVPYLFKEQIEAEGWEYKQTNKIRYWYEKESPEIGGNWYGYYIYKAKLIHDPEMKYLKILFSFDAVEDECVFEGECKDINTFKQIQKLLHI